MKYPIYKNWWFWFGLIIIVGTIVGDIMTPRYEPSSTTDISETTTTSLPDRKEPPIQETNVTSTEKLAESPAIESPTVEAPVVNNVEPLKANVERTVGKDRLKEFSVEDKEIKIVFKSSVGWSAKTAKNRIFLDITHIAEKIKEANIPYEKAIITSRLNFVDKYGQEAENDAVMVVLPKETIDKINFKKFNSDNIREVAASGFIHPALQKKGN